MGDCIINYPKVSPSHPALCISKYCQCFREMYIYIVPYFWVIRFREALRHDVSYYRTIGSKWLYWTRLIDVDLFDFDLLACLCAVGHAHKDLFILFKYVEVCVCVCWKTADSISMITDTIRTVSDRVNYCDDEPTLNVVVIRQLVTENNVRVVFWVVNPPGTSAGGNSVFNARGKTNSWFSKTNVVNPLKPSYGHTLNVQCHTDLTYLF